MAALPIRVCDACFDEALSKRADNEDLVDQSLLPDGMVFSSPEEERVERLKAAKTSFALQMSFKENTGGGSDSNLGAPSGEGVSAPQMADSVVREVTSKVKLSNIPWQSPFSIDDVPHSARILFMINVVTANSGRESQKSTDTEPDTTAAELEVGMRARKKSSNLSDRITKLLGIGPSEEDETYAVGATEEITTSYMCDVNWQEIVRNLAEASKSKYCYRGGASVEAVLDIWHEDTFAAKFPDVLRGDRSASVASDNFTILSMNTPVDSGADVESTNGGPPANSAPDLRLKVRMVHHMHRVYFDASRVVMTVACLLLLLLASLVLVIDSPFPIPAGGGVLDEAFARKLSPEVSDDWCVMTSNLEFRPMEEGDRELVEGGEGNGVLLLPYNVEYVSFMWNTIFVLLQQCAIGVVTTVVAMIVVASLLTWKHHRALKHKIAHLQKAAKEAQDASDKAERSLAGATGGSGGGGSGGGTGSAEYPSFEEMSKRIKGNDFLGLAYEKHDKVTD
jgi:hypothetical protein